MSERRQPVPRIACSFCGVADQDVERIIAGPRCFICSVCVDLCREMLEDGPGQRWARECGAAEYDSWGSAWDGG